jgi:hypothetical protein
MNTGEEFIIFRMKAMLLTYPSRGQWYLQAPCVLIFIASAFLSRLYLCVMYLPQYTAIIPLHWILLLVFIEKMHCILCDRRAKVL